MLVGMAPLGTSWSKAEAVCPNPEHAGSRVRFDGHYGAPGLSGRAPQAVASGDLHEASRSLTGRRSWARSAAPRSGSCATTTAASRTQFVLASPNAELYLCEWHLRHALERLMGKIRADDGHRAAIDELLPQVEAAFTGRTASAPTGC